MRPNHPSKHSSLPPSLLLKSRGRLCDMEAITISWLFRITSPIPALPSSLNVAPSKFILYISPGGAFHLVLSLAMGDCFFGCTARNSIREVKARCDTWSRGKPSGAHLILLRPNQMVHVSIAKNSALQSDSRTKDSICGKSEKIIVCLKFHWGSSSQIEDRLGHFQSTCNTSSACFVQWGQVGFSMMQRRTRFSMVGSALRLAHHRKFFFFC